ncbi:AI-2E family transporter [Rhodopirellula sp.]|nr:AI-2E family transporter [Rhodopirellula sp.]MDB4394086.1 AI-2E family transporter [Rhodopirellula sp.]MDB4770611.1 AI-2E family transporter [bacterium]
MPKRKKQRKTTPAAVGPHTPAKKSTAESSSVLPEPDSSGTDTPKTHPSPHGQSPSVMPPLPSLSRILSVVMLILGILAVGALFYKVMAGFFVPLFLAALLVVLFRPVYLRILNRSKQRRQLAAMATTFLIMTVVLFPIFLLLSVAASQFTAMVSHVNFNDLSAALDRGREQVGISLPYAEQFRRLDLLSDSLDEPERPARDGTPIIGSDPKLAQKMVVENITEALTLVRYLQTKVDGPATADEAARIAEERLLEFREAVQTQAQESADTTPDELIGKLSAEEKFHRQSVIASAAIRSWMRILLGGTFQSQVRLLANPSTESFKDLLNRGREVLQPRFVSMTSATGGFLLQSTIGLLVLVIAIYFFLLDGAGMIRTLMRLSPLDDNYEARLLLEFDRTSRAVVLASVCSALAQGVLAAIAFWALGFDSVIFLFLVTSLMALVPFLGAASVWIPCVLYLGAVEERWYAALFLLIYGAAVVSSIDNVIKMYVLHGRSTMHPLFALLSVLGGVKVFGPIGILVGPMVVVFMQTLLEILNHELAERDASTIIAEPDRSDSPETQPESESQPETLVHTSSIGAEK